MSALGDVFIALPHINSILSHHKDDEVWILTSPPFEHFFINNPSLNVRVLDRDKRIHKNSTFNSIKWVRKQRFDVIYDLQGNRTSRLLVRFSNAHKRVGTKPKSVYSHYPPALYTKNTQQNMFDHLYETLESAGVPKTTIKDTLHPLKNDIEFVHQWKKKNGIDKRPFAIFHAGGSSDWPSKRWPAENYIQLAKQIEKTGIKCILVGSQEDIEINAYISEEIGIDATNNFSVLQLHLFGKKAAYAITSDSGPMHILASTGIPVFGFFGPTSWVRSHAAGQGHRVLNNNTECSPCFKGVCPPSKGHICINTISPEYVFKKILNDPELKLNIKNRM